MTGRLLVIGDSLTYHGPSGPELVTELCGTGTPRPSPPLSRRLR